MFVLPRRCPAPLRLLSVEMNSDMTLEGHFWAKIAKRAMNPAALMNKFDLTSV